MNRLRITQVHNATRAKPQHSIRLNLECGTAKIKRRGGLNKVSKFDKSSNSPKI